MAENSPPSLDPANQGSMTGLLRSVMNKFLQTSVDGMLPARIVSFDREKNLASVVPMIMVVTTENSQVSRAGIAEVPVFQIGGGDFLLNFNLKAGDLGWIIANDRDIALFLQSFSESAPNSERKHSFSDAVFFPHIMTGYDIDPADLANGAAVLQNLDGSVKISLWENNVSITALNVGITTTTMSVSGNLLVVGDVVAGFGSSDISLLTHTHGGVTTGGGNTNVPNPV